MQTYELSGSRVGLAVRCPASVLPCATPLNLLTEEGDLGSAVHDSLRDRLRGGDWSALESARTWNVDEDEVAVLNHMAWQLWTQHLGAIFPSPRVETTIDHEPTPGQRLEGTLDLYALPSPTEARVLDWKTGRADDADHRDQLRAYAYLLTRRFAEVERVYGVVAWIRRREWDADYYTRRELEMWWAKVLRGLGRTPTTYNPGRHCRFCPRYYHCDARVRADVQDIWSFATNADRPDGLPVELPADPTERAGVLIAAWETASKLERLLAASKERIRGQVELADGPLTAADGTSIRMGERRIRKVRPEESWKFLIQLFGGNLGALLRCVEVRKTRLEEAIREAAPQGQKAAAVSAFLAQLEAADAIAVESQPTIEIRRGTPAGGGLT